MRSAGRTGPCLNSWHACWAASSRTVSAHFTPRTKQMVRRIAASLLQHLSRALGGAGHVHSLACFIWAWLAPNSRGFRRPIRGIQAEWAEQVARRPPNTTLRPWFNCWRGSSTATTRTAGALFKPPLHCKRAMPQSRVTRNPLTKALGSCKKTPFSLFEQCSRCRRVATVKNCGHN